MAMIWKQMIERAANAFGYEVRRRGSFHVDPFYDQELLLRGTKVRHVFDVGANTGQTALRYASMFPDATVHSFEPFADTFAQLRQATQHCPTITPHQLAIADATGTTQLYCNADHTTNSLLPLTAGLEAVYDGSKMRATGSAEVPTTTVADFCREHGVDQLDILKLDVQGAERLVLEGARPMLEAQRIDLIYTEVIYAELYKGGVHYYDLFHFLEEQSYRLYGLYQLTYGRRNSVLGWGDAIFVSRRIVDSLPGRGDF